MGSYGLSPARLMEPGMMLIAFREHRLDQLLDVSSILGDKGYVGLGILTPVKKPVGGR